MNNKNIADTLRAAADIIESIEDEHVRMADRMEIADLSIMLLNFCSRLCHIAPVIPFLRKIDEIRNALLDLINKVIR